jgi:hypothetical protein
MKTKLIIGIFLLLLAVGITGTFWGTQIAEAASSLWNSCPRGRVNCLYPGQCNLYIDTNGDRICDRSQSAPVTTSTTTSVKPATTTVAANTQTTTPVASQTTASSNTQGGVLAAELPSNTQDTTSSLVNGQDTGVSGTSAVQLKHSYYILPILLGLGILYALTWTLSAKKIIKNLLHRKIWNLVLLVFMLISALLGLFLILEIDFNMTITLPFNMLFWHVETGIGLGIIGIFHILWHWRYFAKLVKVTP